MPIYKLVQCTGPCIDAVSLICCAACKTNESESLLPVVLLLSFGMIMDCCHVCISLKVTVLCGTVISLQKEMSS